MGLARALGAGLLALGLAACVNGGGRGEPGTTGGGATGSGSAQGDPFPVLPSQTYTPHPLPNGGTIIRPPLRVALLKDAAGLGMAWLMSKYSDKYEFTVADSPKEVAAGLAGNQYDLALIPADLAALLHAEGVTRGDPYDVKALAVGGLGSLRVVAKGAQVASLEDLAGRTVYLVGAGGQEEYALTDLLEEAGVAGQVQLVFLAGAEDVVQRVSSRKEAVAVLAEPDATALASQDPAVVTALDLTREWKRFHPDSELVASVLTERPRLFDSRSADVEEFLELYEQSVDFANDKPKAAGKMAAAAGIAPDASLAAKAIPDSHLVFHSGRETEADLLGFYKELFLVNPDSTGRLLPGRSFYHW